MDDANPSPPSSLDLNSPPLQQPPLHLHPFVGMRPLIPTTYPADIRALMTPGAGNLLTDLKQRDFLLTRLSLLNAAAVSQFFPLSTSTAPSGPFNPLPPLPLMAPIPPPPPPLLSLERLAASTSPSMPLPPQRYPSPPQRSPASSPSSADSKDASSSSLNSMKFSIVNILKPNFFGPNRPPLSSSCTPPSSPEVRGPKSPLEASSPPLPLTSKSKSTSSTCSQSPTSPSVSSKTGHTSPSLSSNHEKLSPPKSSSPPELKNGKTNLPAWIFCTRYSDRPSSEIWKRNSTQMSPQELGSARTRLLNNTQKITPETTPRHYCNHSEWIILKGESR
ncbi:unnamed protein product [Cyprideis torosa]|uniref:Uncharacterized protein n=1 Tax=Cyprideis torosa TaxID=163714 RepID=A0A7R8W7Z3_9CRUS|nr:unnamed protein product [Cyprideis torosa]CAG0882657.1 unnamed protein product [Cyprideis torosa]